MGGELYRENIAALISNYEMTIITYFQLFQDYQYIEIEKSKPIVTQ
jgi:hypothetical protein